MPQLWIQNEEGGLMSPRELKYQVSLFATLAISLLPILIVSLGGTLLFGKAVGQQQEDQQNVINSTDSIFNQNSDIENQSSAIVDSTQNQSNANQTGMAALSANLTQSDFDLLRQDLSEARQALVNNDTTALLDELNFASGELFQVSSRHFDPNHVEAMTEEFNPLQTNIDRAQETALKDNHTGTLEELNAAESELFTIIQMLPSG
jgi:nitrate reductase NapE component